MITVHDVKQRSPEWFKLREGKWTGSTAIKLLQGKPLPTSHTDFQSSSMKRGQLLESIAIREFEVAENAPKGVLTVGFITNSKYPNAGYSPDGVFGDTLLEVKCLNGARHEKLVKGVIPLEYLAQIHFGMLICELKKAKLLAFNPEYVPQLTILGISHDPAITRNIKKKLTS